jgi:hypothetical protein
VARAAMIGPAPQSGSPKRAGDEVCLIFRTPDNAAAKMSGPGAASADRFGSAASPTFFVLAGCLRPQAKKRTGIGVHLGARKDESFQDLKSAMSGVLKISSAQSEDAIVIDYLGARVLLGPGAGGLFGAGGSCPV